MKIEPLKCISCNVRPRALHDPSAKPWHRSRRDGLCVLCIENAERRRRQMKHAFKETMGRHSRLLGVLAVVLAVSGCCKSDPMVEQYTQSIVEYDRLSRLYRATMKAYAEDMEELERLRSKCGEPGGGIVFGPGDPEFPAPEGEIIDFNIPPTEEK